MKSENTKQSLVSILVNAYNAERYLEEALDSALAQTYQNFEVVVLDDQSTDRTPEIAKEYAVKDARIRHVRPEKRLGLKEGRNELLRQARGAYFTYLDSDDIYLPAKVEEEVNFLEQHRDVAAVYCSILYFFDGAPQTFYRHRYEFYSGADVLPHLLEKMFITNTATMFRRDVYDKLGGYDPALGMVEDWEYFLRMAYRGYQIAFLDRDLVHYRLRWDNNTNFARQLVIQDSAVKIFENLRGHMAEADRVRYNIDHWLAKRKETYVVALVASGRGEEARALLKTIAPHVGFGKRAAITLLSFSPAAISHFAIEQAWSMRKKNLFVPARDIPAIES